MENRLTFTALRQANAQRVKQFRNAQGRLAHPNGVDNWNLSQWSNAAAGEMGEACNLIKKIERGDFSGPALDDAYEELGRELADIVTYIDLVAQRAKVELGAYVSMKFNEVSRKVQSNVFIEPDGSWAFRGEWPRDASS